VISHLSCICTSNTTCRPLLRNCTPNWRKYL